MTIKGTNASEKSEVRRTVSVARMTGIETACEVLGERGGQKAVAETLGVSVRAVFDKRHGNTSISDFEVRILARELAAVGERCTRVSTNLLAEIGLLPASQPAASKGPTA